MRICLVLDDPNRRAYHHQEIKSLVDNPHFDISHVLIDASYDPDTETTINSGLTTQLSTFTQKLARREFSVLVDLEQRVADILAPSRTVTSDRKKLEQRRNVFDIDGLHDCERIQFHPKQVGTHTYEFPDELVDRIGTEADVVVLLGFSRILRGRILTEPEYGVLSFHGADIRRYRGRPGGFFQFVNGEDEIGMTLQQLTPDLDGGRSVDVWHTDISDARSWKETRYRVEKLYGSLLVDGLEQLQEPTFEPQQPDPPGQLTYSSDADELKVVYRCLKRTLLRRYLSHE